MKPLIIANWKCNPVTLNEAKKLFDLIKKGIKSMKNTEVVICPPFVYLPNLGASVSVKGFRGLCLGSQDVFWKEKGAFTGEISTLMLKNLGCVYVIIGHSERRRYFCETDEMINKKIKAVIAAGLKPVLCVAGLSQLKKSLKGIAQKVIIAYEPVFAIGTGESCSIVTAKKMRNAIKYPFVLYGGSVNSRNAGDYIEKAGFQGLLVGGASLNKEEFIKILKALN